MKTNYTPGPWRVGKQNGHCGISINADKVESVATVYLGLITSRVEWDGPTLALPENAQSVANAKLIAAAPELLEMLSECYKWFLAAALDKQPGGRDAAMRFNTAITKATA